MNVAQTPLRVALIGDDQIFEDSLLYAFKLVGIEIKNTLLPAIEYRTENDIEGPYLGRELVFPKNTESYIGQMHTTYDKVEGDTGTEQNDIYRANGAAFMITHGNSTERIAHIARNTGERFFMSVSMPYSWIHLMNPKSQVHWYDGPWLQDLDGLVLNLDEKWMDDVSRCGKPAEVIMNTEDHPF